MASSALWPVTLRSGDLALRPLRMSDRAEWMAVRGRNREWLAPWEASNPQPGGSLPTFRDMVRSLTHQAREGSALPFVITLDDPRTRRAPIVGQLTVSSIVWGSALMATLGYWVDREHAGRGIAPTAVAMATDHCFRELGLHRMEINIRPENAPSLRVVEKLRFRREGLRPRFLHINGAWADHESFALTAEEVPAEGLLGRWLASR
ncbi:N-acetyltransferase GCN5 [Sinomonas cellulolyticus]|uniref:GNAT family N-acetyltransferase n=1 Tax=Sinomonas cellulolyticus TaxID=2801916 RepID=A0ABS1JZB5_9MICC|nr:MULTISPECIES: GNAT family protein [Sinomonas]MBL0704751.1 GNAT family N-acetyltransferase [Sinomonas cellulolyticus]GHG46852.1 N-acetyltransferase GCN5 [Sinomonas sp. KCTC 49339]